MSRQKKTLGSYIKHFKKNFNPCTTLTKAGRRRRTRKMMSSSLPLVLFPSFLFLTKWKKFLTKLSQEEKTKKKKTKEKKKQQADRTGQDREAQAAVYYRVGGRMGSIPARLGPVLSGSASAQPSITFGQRTRRGEISA